MFDIEIALMPNKKLTKIGGKLKKIPNKAKVGARQTEQTLIIESVVAPIVEDITDASFAPNFIFNIERIIEMTKKIRIMEAGIINSHWGGNSCVMLSPQSKYLVS